MRWQTEAADRDRFAEISAAARALYADAGAWEMERHRYQRDLPDEWFIPAMLIREWGARRQADELVRAGFWRKIKFGMHIGYTYRWILFENTPAYLVLLREDGRDRKRQQRRGASQRQHPRPRLRRIS